ncbi:hypothetical protein GWI33_004627 [Rhynchophorus ferrugineus]|uniref:Uncharacterized protein n=1 Tax=Rhynchophorus ferrugineus TaxID=354439 RepID=A0A834J2Q5_RHYFE|nr:hypothetical protein GWI33_004627 [Rhynchophorus ferrugineus]
MRLYVYMVYVTKIKRSTFLRRRTPLVHRSAREETNQKREEKKGVKTAQARQRKRKAREQRNDGGWMIWGREGRERERFAALQSWPVSEAFSEATRVQYFFTLFPGVGIRALSPRLSPPLLPHRVHPSSYLYLRSGCVSILKWTRRRGIF